jgi:hypothetical protein
LISCFIATLVTARQFAIGIGACSAGNTGEANARGSGSDDGSSFKDFHREICAVSTLICEFEKILKGLRLAHSGTSSP